ncbi:hypothetical protein Q3A66_15860 [Hymenobacter sp. BT770]|uniref:hypothetical protein n=1 Tax=Hymenobacter sp. BT770 TaxID=2886942 RepID=UPI001D0FD5A1|nr:hypothetical protein [Hymenobacter sp. BT770]MCC3154740.1 hypothetical protein [Hymenobacter sp. BT770]MDO3416545.1 hypothetical protein [Hymenobacter sp. BT770]
MQENLREQTFEKMDLNLLTIAQRATLSLTITNSFTNALSKISQIEALADKIDGSAEFTTDEKAQNRNFSIIGLTSISEHLLNEILYRVLISYPKKLGSKQFAVDELLDEGSILELFYKKANQKVLDLAYGKFERFVRQFSETVELTAPLSHEIIGNVNEVKCTRDCIIHSDGKANDQYFGKAGQQARVSRNGEKLDTTLAYFHSSVATFTRFITDIRDALPSKYADSTKSYVFKQMWEATCLNRRVKFDQAWTIIDGSMVRPVKLDNDFGFSSSELVMHDLFRHMYSYDRFPVDFPLLFKKWKPQSNEHQIAISWLDNQFYF